jgi:hypothetical protein
MLKRTPIIAAGIGIIAIVGSLAVALIQSAGLPQWVGTSRLGGGTLINYHIRDWKSSYTSVSSIAAAPDGALWFGTTSMAGAKGIYRFDGSRWTHYPSWWQDLPHDDGMTCEDSVSAIAAAPDGALWFGCIGGALRFDGKTWTPYITREGEADNSILSIAVAPDGALWFGTRDGGIRRFDGVQWTRFTQRQAPDGPANDYVLSVAVAHDGALWFGTGRGVSRFDGQHWTHYTSQGASLGLEPEGDSLADDWVTSIAVTPDGALWLGMRRGISRLAGGSWTTYTIRDGLAGDMIWSMAVAPNGMLWAGTDHGLSRFDGRAWTAYTAEDGLPGEAVSAVGVAADGTLWFGSSGGYISKYLPPDTEEAGN